VAVKTRRQETTEATREALLAVAKELFAERGYSAVSTEDIVRGARVSRGALYHHFRDKRDLFRAVFERVDHELVADLSNTEEVSDPWERFTARWSKFLDACVNDRAAQRIVFVEGPAILGWSEWRSLDAGHALAAVRDALEDAMNAGVMRRRPVDPLAQIFLGALNEAGMVVANSRDQDAARTAVAETLAYIVDSLRIRPQKTRSRQGLT
jgi:AcrR family transcriptional regulator